MIPIYEADRLEDLPLFDRPPQAEEDVDAAVAAILADVRTRGDAALREYTRRFDGADLERFEVTAEELRAAWDCVDGNFRETLRQAADNIRHFGPAWCWASDTRLSSGWASAYPAARWLFPPPF